MKLTIRALSSGKPVEQELHINAIPKNPMSKEDQRQSLAEWQQGRRTIRGPYAEGETEQDRNLRLEREEAERTSRLVMHVIFVMAVLVLLFVGFWLFFHQR